MKIFSQIFKPHAILAVGVSVTLLVTLTFLLLYGSASLGEGVSGSLFVWGIISLNTLALALSGIARAKNERRFSSRIDTAVAAIKALSEGQFKTSNLELGDDQVTRVLSALSKLHLKLENDWVSQRVTDNGPQWQQLVENMQAKVMVTDAQDRITYVNRTMSAQIGRYPTIADGDLHGTQLDQLFPDQNWSEAIANQLHDCGVLEIAVAKHSVRLSCSALNAKDHPFGRVIIWDDLTAEQQFDQEVQAIVHAAACGDLSQRIADPRLAGSRHGLASGINNLMSSCEAVIEDTLRVFSALAGGRLDETIEADYEGAFDQLKEDANCTVNRLREVVVNIQQSSESVSTAFREINEGNLNLSQRTEQQAASLEETSCSMEQMTATVQKNAENAQRANDLAIKAREKAANGGRVVGLAVTAMTEINDASGKIADIIGVIDEIAFQTNLLALNASVEAARAGEQGRGFAVVAGEVRNLAGRSAEAAKEIKSLIQDSVAKVENGSSLVNQSGRTLNEIVAGVQEVTDIVAEISAASMEQASGIAEVNSTITQMDDMTQQNAALVEQVSAASESAGEQAGNLTTLISFFSTQGLDIVVPEFEANPVPCVHPPLDTRWEPSSLPPSTTIIASQAANSDISGDWEEF